MIARQIVERVAGALATDEGLVEKDWHVVRAISLLTAFDHQDATPVFSGGTSLLKGWNLIKRFSEDIDFKVEMPPSATRSEGRRLRAAYRERLLSEFMINGFEVEESPLIGNESQFFSAGLIYPSHFRTGYGLRPHIRIEMSFTAPALKPVLRPIGSLIAMAQKEPPEVAGFPCVDPVETAADKLSTLAWRVCARRRGTEGDDATIIRHLHDLAALEKTIMNESGFPALARKTAQDDTGRGGALVPAGPRERFASMLERLHSDNLWASEYETYVLQVSFARPEETIRFNEALSITRRLVDSVYQRT